MDDNHQIFAHHKAAMEKLIKAIPVIASNHARNFFDNSWSNKGFTDQSIDIWKPVKRKDGTEKERPLVESGALRRSLRTDPEEGLVYSDIVYAGIHNEGGTINKTTTVKEHTRKGKTVKSHDRKVNTTIPQRKFMGPSATLDKEIEEIIIEQLDMVFRKK